MTVRPTHEISAIIAGAECPLLSQSLYDGYRREFRIEIQRLAGNKQHQVSPKSR